MHVLILGARAPAALEWARAFQACGWRVTAADSLAWPLTRASTAVQAYRRLPEPRTRYAEWLQALRDCVTREAVDLVLPTCEEVFYLAHGQHRLPCRVLTSRFELLHELHHKHGFAQRAAAWPAGAPQTALICSRAELAAYEPVARQCVFKPAYSRFASRTLIRPSAKALARVQPTPMHPWVAQSFVPGREHCSFSLLVNGQVTAHAVYHPRHRVGRGSGIWFEPGDPPPVRDFVEHFGRVTGYSGQVGFDFIEGRDGRWFVLECNPRATSGVHLFADQPQALVAALLGEAVAAPVTPSPRMVALAMLLFVAPRRAWHPGFWRDWSAARDVVVRPGDRGPLLAQVPGLIEILGRAARGRRGLLAAATADIEWDGQPIEDGA